MSFLQNINRALTEAGTVINYTWVYSEAESTNRMFKNPLLSRAANEENKIN